MTKEERKLIRYLIDNQNEHGMVAFGEEYIIIPTQYNDVAKEMKVYSVYIKFEKNGRHEKTVFDANLFPGIIEITTESGTEKVGVKKMSAIDMAMLQILIK